MALSIRFDRPRGALTAPFISPTKSGGQPLHAQLAPPLVKVLARQVMAAGNIGKCPPIRVDLAKDPKLRCVRPSTATLNAKNLDYQPASTAYDVHNDVNNDVA